MLLRWSHPAAMAAHCLRQPEQCLGRSEGGQLHDARGQVVVLAHGAEVGNCLHGAEVGNAVGVAARPGGGLTLRPLRDGGGEHHRVCLQ